VDWLATRLLEWYDRHGRKNLPWQLDRTPYRVWVSEIMLQQTQVSTVTPYFVRFMQRFPNVPALAQAELDDVLHQWTGLGYYARGRNLHAAAKVIVARHSGELPRTHEELVALPGIGRSTAGAILSSAFGIRAPILDGNAKRALSRFHAEGSIDALWRHADAHTPDERVGDYTQAIMDLGATVCVRTRPVCALCPVSERCESRAAGTIERFPPKKQRRDMPVKTARMFVIVDPDGRYLLEQRQTNGLWGGLWGPLERSSATSTAEILAEIGAHDDHVDVIVELAPFRHTFTHFHLDIAPVRIELNYTPGVVRDGERLRWHRPTDDKPLGLFAPAVRLLQSQLEVPA
jgi:A/G-specific adenine glycosylase